MAIQSTDDGDFDEVLRGVAAAPPVSPPGVAGESHAMVAAKMAGARLGQYQLLERIGEGGMGVVYRARRVDAQYQQTVAIKILSGGLASPNVVARFRHERQILASLDHPGIVRLLDGGSTDAGIPYLVMEHIEGVPLATYAKALPLPARIELVVQISKALQHAHQKLVVHRDIKPGNVLVTAAGTPRLLDFGIAKLLDPEATLEHEPLTRTGAALLTLEYASPEQVRGEPVSVATDVYSLGAVLYELLVGHPPQRARGDALETLRIICEVDPPRPSTVAPQELRRELAGDLDNIVAKALQKIPARRYASVAEMGEDLERYLNGLPIRARDATLGYRLRKFVGRNRGALLLAVAITVALALTTVLSILQARRADAQAARAEQQTRALLVEQGIRELAGGRDARALPYLVAALREGEDTSAVRFLVAEAEQPLRRDVALLDKVAAGLTGLAWSPDGTRFATTAMDGIARFYDPRGKLLAQGAGRGVLRLPTFSPDGKRLALWSDNSALELWDAETGALVATLPAHAGVSQVPAGPIRFDARSRRFVATDATGSTAVFEAARGEKLLELPISGEQRCGCAFSPDGERLACGTQGGGVELRDAATGALLSAHEAHRGEIGTLEFTSDGARLFTAGADDDVRIWDAHSGALLSTLESRADGIWTMSFNRSGTKLVTADSDGTAKIWDTRTGKLVANLAGRAEHVVSVARFSPDETKIVTAVDRTFQLWDASTGSLIVTLEVDVQTGTAPHSPSHFFDLSFTPDSTQVMTAAGVELRLWDAGRQPLLAELHGAEGLSGASLSPDKSRVAITGWRGLLELFDLSRPRAPALIKRLGDGTLWDVRWSPDGTRLAVVGEHGLAQLFAADGAFQVALPGHQGTVNQIAFSPDGSRVSTAGDDHTARIWNAVGGAPISTLSTSDRVLATSWSHDGKRLATAGWDGKIIVWDAASGRRATEIANPGAQFLDVEFSPDDRRFVTAGHDGRIDVWNVETGARLLELEGHSGAVSMASWSPDGLFIASSSDDSTVRIWDAATGKLLTTLPHSGEVMSATWSRDGEWLVTTDHAELVRIWDVHRDLCALSEIADFAVAHSPWQLVDGRLELRASTSRNARAR